jgi:Tubulin folding cofactor D C terminal
VGECRFSRIDASRLFSFVVLMQLTTMDLDIPASTELQSVLCTAAPIHERIQIQRLVYFVAWPAYREKMLEALVACIGGINVDLREKCADALVCLLCSPEHMAIGKSDALSAEGATFCSTTRAG